MVSICNLFWIWSLYFGSFFSVTIQDRFYSCNGYTSLASRGHGHLFNGSSFSIGRPQLCSMGEYIPMCTSISEDEATVICYSSEGKYGELNLILLNIMLQISVAK